MADQANTGTGSGNGTGEIGGTPPSLPAFYQRPVLLDAQRHSHLSVKENAGYAFARGVHSLLLNASEFAVASRFYPIVFAGEGAAAVPMAVVGARPQQNLFVDDAGHWVPGAYVPAYVRRYPFIFTESPDRSKLGLCVDEACDFVVESDVRPLFADGKRTDVVEKALEFCVAYQREFEASKAFVAGLTEQDLLVPNQAEMRLKSGERLAIGGFKVVDQAKFNALPDDVFLDWRKRGWLPLVYFHIVSVLNWSTLLDRTAGNEP